jgi:hypothetical protein
MSFFENRHQVFTFKALQFGFGEKFWFGIALCVRGMF